MDVKEVSYEEKVRVVQEWKDSCDHVRISIALDKEVSEEGIIDDLYSFVMAVNDPDKQHLFKTYIHIDGSIKTEEGVQKINENELIEQPTFNYQKKKGSILDTIKSSMNVNKMFNDFVKQ